MNSYEWRYEPKNIKKKTLNSLKIVYGLIDASLIGLVIYLHNAAKDMGGSLSWQFYLLVSLVAFFITVGVFSDNFPAVFTKRNYKIYNNKIVINGFLFSRNIPLNKIIGFMISNKKENIIILSIKKFFRTKSVYLYTELGHRKQLVIVLNNFGINEIIK